MGFCILVVFIFHIELSVCGMFRFNVNIFLDLVHQLMSEYCGSSLQWRHNERDGVSNHRRLDCLLNRLFRHRTKKTSKFHVTGLCEGNLPVTSGFPSQMASNTENVSIRWRHHVLEYHQPQGQGLFYKHELTFIPVWLSNHIHYTLCDGIIYPFQNFNGWLLSHTGIVGVWEWINNFIPQYIMDMIT